MGFLKGKSAIRLHRDFPSKERGSKHFWIRGYFVSTVGLDEKKFREYIRDQEKTDKQQMELIPNRPVAPFRGPTQATSSTGGRWLGFSCIAFEKNILASSNFPC
ncbi:transposase [Thermodesulfobacteriota bacterium]